MAETLRPLFDRVLVERAVASETTSDGLFNPSASKDVMNRGTVLSVGPGIRDNGELIPVSVKAGDTVIWGKYDGQDIKINGKDGFVVFAERELIAVIEEA
jgi:chaperonin GroES